MSVGVVALANVVRHIIVTGASGYIGSRLVEMALAAGWKVTVLGRQPLRSNGIARPIQWALGAPLPADAMDPDTSADAQALIHLAHDWTNAPSSEDPEGGLNIEGTRTLLRASRAHGLRRFVCVSSQSARADAANIYGRVKWRIEQELVGPGEVAGRVGLVYGGRPQGMFGLLTRLAARAPVLPMVDPWRGVQPIHLDEVCLGLLRLVEGDQVGWLGIASPYSIPFGNFLKILARELHGRHLLVLPIPHRLALLACDALHIVPFGPKVDRERILGLVGTQPMECADHLTTLGLNVEPFAERLRREPASRKTALAEGRVMLKYILRRAPGSALTRRYARALVATGPHGPLPLPRLLHASPALLRVIEPVNRAAPLARRLALATALAEASPQGEQMLARAGRLVRILSGLADLALDALLLPLRLLAGLLAR
jgi:nucleoside-diphosphate-sugar epimerase